MSDFYRWVIETYLNKKMPSGDFAYDLWRDKKAMLIETNKDLFYHIECKIWDIRVETIYRKLRKKFLKYYYLRDKYTGSIYEKEDKKFKEEHDE